jgi:hypothetical protein
MGWKQPFFGAKFFTNVFFLKNEYSITCPSLLGWGGGGLPHFVKKNFFWLHFQFNFGLLIFLISNF